jgi:Tol biopolymer transport system component/DNA-binding winged helix-turn-helix (wHTH) protein
MHLPRTPRLDTVRFGDFELDLQSGEIRRNGSRMLLPEQPFRILALLVRRPGELVTRDELRYELWPADTFVDFEHSLNAAIKRLREALGDSATKPVYIETIPRRGYRFVAPVLQPAAIATPPVNVAVQPRSRALVSLLPRIAAVGTAALIVGVAARMLTAIAPARSAWLPTKLTFTSGVNIDPALSPDGTLVAYASDRAGVRSNIWLQSAGGGDAIRLTADDADDEEPSFAPDGRQLVFSRRDTGVLMIGALGGSTRVIAQEAWARTPRISPNGRMLAYWTGFPASAVAGGIAGAPGSLRIVSIDGGVSRTVPVRLASARYPVWSPDSTHLLFLGDEDTDVKRFDWYVTDLAGSTLVKTGAVGRIRQPGLQSGPPIPSGWTGAHGTVIFASNESTTSSVWRVDISPATGAVTSEPERLTFGTATERSPSAATSGRITVASVHESVAIYRVPLDDVTGVASGPLERVTEPGVNARLRAVSADGRWLAFVSARTTRDEVWERDLHTGAEHQLTFSGSDGATLSPDGSRAIVERDANGQRCLDVLSPFSNARGDLCRDCDAPQDWSPDGRRVLVEAGRPTRLVVIELLTRARTALAAHSTWNLDMARFSPDGRWIAFHTTTSPNSRHVYVVPAGGTSVPQSEWVPVVSDHGCHPSWSADGTRVYHFSFRDGAFCPWVQRVDPATKRPLGAPSPVLHLHTPRLRVATGALATNIVRAGYFYFTATEMSSDVFLLEPQRPAKSR